jgi:hypothetical protein
MYSTPAGGETSSVAPVASSRTRHRSLEGLLLAVIGSLGSKMCSRVGDGTA